MLKSNGAFRAVHFTEVVHILEGPLREVPLYTHVCVKEHRTLPTNPPWTDGNFLTYQAHNQVSLKGSYIFEG